MEYRAYMRRLRAVKVVREVRRRVRREGFRKVLSVEARVWRGLEGGRDSRYQRMDTP